MVPVDVIYQDEKMLVVNKPSGMVTTREKVCQISDLRSQNRYLEDWIGENFKINLPRQGIVHRLDKGTSGLVLVAKTEETLKKLQSLIKRRQIVKKYYALVSGVFPFEAEVKMPISRDVYNFEAYRVSELGKEAWTLFKRIKIVNIEGRKYSLIEANLKTGRTHQIRVHLKYLKYPIVGDKLYGGEIVSWLSRIFLHAYYLKVEGKIWKIDLPIDLRGVVSNE